VDDLKRVLEIEAIRQLKYRYFRFLDLKLWDELEKLFVEDATSAYAGGQLAFEGREAIMRFLRDALGRPTMLTAHHGHHPEIELTSETSATGIWALWDTVIDVEHGLTIRGAAFYRDEYVKLDGAWKIKSTGYERTYEEMAPRPGPVKLTANRFAAEAGNR
jgi:hypothetical protein